MQAVKDHGRPDVKKLICEVEFNNPSYFRSKFESLLNSPATVDAVLFSTNTLSIMGLKVIIDMGIRVPEDLAVFCFDQSESYDLFYCPISYVHQPLEEIGQRAVQILFDRMSNKQNTYQQVILNAALVIRKSCGI